MNDAKCDPAGRLVAGTTAFDFTPHSAALYCVEPGWSFRRIISRVTQSNGIAWSPDGSQLYFIDSATQGVHVFDYDAGTGSVGNRRRLVTIERTHGVPDGMTTDSNGNLWVACFGGAAVRCFSPAGGGAGRGPLSSYPGDELHLRRRLGSGSVCDLSRLPVEHRPVAEGAACGCDLRLPSRGGGHARVVIRRVDELQRARRRGASCPVLARPEGRSLDTCAGAAEAAARKGQMGTRRSVRSGSAPAA